MVGVHAAIDIFAACVLLVFAYSWNILIAVLVTVFRFFVSRSGIPVPVCAAIDCYVAVWIEIRLLCVSKS